MSNDNKIKEKDDNDRRLGMFATIIAILGIFIPWGRDIGTQANPAPIEICFFGVLLGICLLFTVVFCSSKVYHIWRNILKWIGELICRWYDNFLLLSTKSLRELLSNVESDGKTDPVDSAVQVDSTKQETFTPDFGQSGSLEQKESGSRVSFIYEGEEFAFLYCEPNADFKMGGPITVKGQSSDGKKTDAPIPVPEIKDAPILEGFWIGETPVTQEQWKKIGVQPKRDCYVTDDEHPVESVSIKECNDFIKEFNKKLVEQLKGWKCSLPTEEEWEYACRAGKVGTGYEVSLDDCAVYGKTRGGTWKVRKKDPNLWKIYDMLGNVWEWTCSVQGSSNVVRGGGWNTAKEVFGSVPRETRSKKSDGTQNIGFRIILKRL